MGAADQMLRAATDKGLNCGRASMERLPGVWRGRSQPTVPCMPTAVMHAGRHRSSDSTGLGWPAARFQQSLNEVSTIASSVTQCCSTPSSPLESNIVLLLDRANMNVILLQGASKLEVRGQLDSIPY